MKKAKFMLALIAAMTVTGGIVAFKAKTTLILYKRVSPTFCAILGQYDPGPTPLTNVYTTGVDLGGSVAASLCTSTFSVVSQ